MWKKKLFSAPKQAFLQRFGVGSPKPYVAVTSKLDERVSEKKHLVSSFPQEHVPCKKESAISIKSSDNAQKDALIKLREIISNKKDTGSSKSLSLLCVQVATISAALGWRKLSGSDSLTSMKNKNQSILSAGLLRLCKLICPSPTHGRFLAVLPLPVELKNEEKQEAKQVPVGDSIDPDSLSSSFDSTFNTCAAWTQNTLGAKFAALQQHGKAVALFQKACSSGLASAQFNLGLCYEKGYGVPTSLQKAAECYAQASNQKHAGAMYNLAGFYFQGVGGLTRSKEMGMALIEEAAQLGLKQAQTYLGLYYFDESTGQRNLSKSHHLFLQAASQQDVDAQYYLGVCYEKGLGVKRDLEEACKWYTRAAQAGHVVATFNLGVFFEYGLGGLNADTNKAIQCYRVAAEAGDEDAQHNLKLLEHSTTDTHNILISLISQLNFSDPLDVPKAEGKLPRHASSPGGLGSLGDKDDMLAQNNTRDINTATKSTDIQLAY